MNVERLRHAVEHMKEEPRRANMNEWRIVLDTLEINHYAEARGYLKPPCGVIGCLAGWGAQLYAEEPEVKRELRTVDQGRAAFALTHSQADRLFALMEWPDNFRHALREVDEGTPEYVAVIADRVEHFILTGGAY